MQDTCTFYKRDKLLEDLSNKHFDVFIIGGGATGAGIALEATRRGLTVGLIQSSDFSSGTSSRYPTCLLLQGGIGFRETENYTVHLNQYQLVPSSKEERISYLKIASYLVEKYTIYSIVESKFDLFRYFWSRLKIKGSYSGFPCISFWSWFWKPFKIFPGTIKYQDHLQQDSRLNISLITTSLQEGAICGNYCRAKSLIDNGNGVIEGVEFYDILTGKVYKSFANTIINATGSGCDFIHHLLPASIPKKTIQKSLGNPKIGFHLILNHPILPPKTSVIKRSNNGSVIFFIHYHDYTLAGIEDWHQSVSDEITKEEVQLVLDELNRYSKSKITISNVMSAWTGWRPLMKNGSSVRDFVIDDSLPGVLSVTGGAWSEFRLMGEKVIDLIKPNTKSILQSILGSRIYSIPKNYIYSVDIPSNTYQRLKSTYGERIKLIQWICKEDSRLSELILKNSDINLISAEIIFHVRYECAQRITDCLLRRTVFGYLNPKESLKCISAISDIMANELNWDEKRKLEEQIIAENELNKLIVK